MKRLFIPAIYEGAVKLTKELISQLPNHLVLAMPVQFLPFKESIKKQLEYSGKKVQFFQSKHGKYPGQILGCDIHKFLGDYDAFLYIGEGKFHPTALLFENEKPVYCFNPFNNKVEKLDKSYLEKLQKKKQALIAKFLQSDKVGILLTTKPGQYQQKLAEELRDRLEKNNKEAYLFLSDEINFSQLENFNFIQSWINTACPRIVEDFSCLNGEEALKYL